MIGPSTGPSTGSGIAADAGTGTENVSGASPSAGAAASRTSFGPPKAKPGVTPYDRYTSDMLLDDGVLLVTQNRYVLSIRPDQWYDDPMTRRLNDLIYS